MTGWRHIWTFRCSALFSFNYTEDLELSFVNPFEEENESIVRNNNNNNNNNNNSNKRKRILCQVSNNKISQIIFSNNSLHALLASGLSASPYWTPPVPSPPELQPPLAHVGIDLVLQTKMQELVQQI